MQLTPENIAFLEEIIRDREQQLTETWRLKDRQQQAELLNTVADTLRQSSPLGAFRRVRRLRREARELADRFRLPYTEKVAEVTDPIGEYRRDLEMYRAWARSLPSHWLLTELPKWQQRADKIVYNIGKHLQDAKPGSRFYAPLQTLLSDAVYTSRTLENELHGIAFGMDESLKYLVADKWRNSVFENLNDEQILSRAGILDAGWPLSNQQVGRFVGQVLDCCHTFGSAFQQAEYETAHAAYQRVQGIQSEARYRRNLFRRGAAFSDQVTSIEYLKLARLTSMVSLEMQALMKPLKSETFSTRSRPVLENGY